MRRVQAHREAWSPGAQADFDQQHAEAMERLRGARTFALVVVDDVDLDGDGLKVCAQLTSSTCETAAHTAALIHVLGQSAAEMRGALDGLA